MSEVATVVNYLTLTAADQTVFTGTRHVYTVMVASDFTNGRNITIKDGAGTTLAFIRAVGPSHQINFNGFIVDGMTISSNGATAWATVMYSASGV